MQEKGQAKNDSYKKFMAEQVGIEISIITPAMVTTVQNYVKDLNDHVQFLDSGAISAKANNARKPEVMERLIQSILASPMGVQQQQETTHCCVLTV